METFLTRQEAARLAGISDREVVNRMNAGEYKFREFPSRLAGRTVKKVILESMNLGFDKTVSHYVPKTSADCAGLADRELPSAKSAQSAVQQLPLPLEDGEAFRFLPNEFGLRDYAVKWFELLSQHDLLHWNGLWKTRFFNRVFTVAAAGGALPREFVINSKTALVEYLAAAHAIPVRTLYTRRKELLDFFRYLDRCRKAGQPPEAPAMAAFFPSWVKADQQRLKHRADRGVSKSIMPEVQQWLLGRFAQGSQPGKDGWRSTLTGALRELETLRDFFALQGGDAEAADLKVPTLSAVRRWWKARPEPSKGVPSGDPAVIWARDGSKRFHNQVVPFTPRSYDMFTHDWWVSDHRTSNVWVWLDSDPELPPFRPYLTWWMDVRSRWPVGFVGALVPSSVTIMRAWKEALLRHHTAPRHAYMDNGKDYLSKVLNGAETPSNDALDARQVGLFERFGVEIHHALPSGRNKRTGETRCHAQSKVIERFFQNLDAFDRAQRGACGESPTDKPEKLTAELFLHAEAVEKWKSAARVSPSADGLTQPFPPPAPGDAGGTPPLQSPLMALSEYLALVENYLLTDYGLHVHRGEGMDCTPLEAFERYQPSRFGIERAQISSAEVAALMLTPPQKATVRNMMVRVDISGRAEYYQHADFYWLTGQQVSVELDPSDPQTAWVSHDGRFVGRAERVAKLAYGATPGLIGAREKLKHYVTRITKERVKLLSAATFLPTQEQLAAMRTAVQQSHTAAPAGIPHAESLERGRKRLTAAPAGISPTSEDVANSMLEEDRA